MRTLKVPKRDFVGDDVYGKTLAIVGLGRVGVEVSAKKYFCFDENAR